MAGLPVYDGLADAAEDLAAAAMRPGIDGKREVLYSLAQGLESVCRAVLMISNSLGDAGYGPEICEPVGAAAIAADHAAVKAQEAMHAIGSLASTKLRDLPASGRQVPRNAELNGVT